MLNPAQIDQLWNFDNPAESEALFRNALTQLAPGVPAHAEVLTQIARAQSLRGLFDAAHTTLDETEPQIKADWTHQRVRLWLERGRTYNSAGHPDVALSFFQRAWELASATAGEDFYAIDAAHMIAIVEPPDQQLVWNLKAMALTEQTTDERAKKWLAALYNNIGWSYHDRQAYDLALEYFNKGLALRQKQGDASALRIARWSVGRVFRSLGRINEALVLQRVLLAEFEQIGERDGYVYEEIGECLLALSQSDAAQPYFALAFEELSKDSYLVKNKSGRLERLSILGRVTVE